MIVKIIKVVKVNIVLNVEFRFFLVRVLVKIGEQVYKKVKGIYIIGIWQSIIYIYMCFIEYFVFEVYVFILQWIIMMFGKSCLK